MKIKYRLLAPEDGLAQAAPAATPAPQEQSFAERKAAQLREERAAQPSEQPEAQEPSTETPPEPEESVQDDGYPELHDEGEQPEGEGEDEALYDETPSDDDQSDDGGEPSVDWEKRFTDTRDELLRLTESQKERDSELVEMMSGSLQLQHELEDNLSKAREYTNFYVEGIDSQLQMMEQAFNSGQVEPDHLPNARAQYHQLNQQKQALNARLEQIEKTAKQAEDQRKKREAQITRVRLSRTIPGWNQEMHSQMRDEAVSRGYSVEEYDKITDYRFFEMLHDSIQLRSAGKTVGDVRQRKQPKPPRGKRAMKQSRDSRGRFEKAKREFHENPNQRGRFAAMKEQELARERRGR